LAKKGEGKGPAAALPSQHVPKVKPAASPAPASATQAPPDLDQLAPGPEVDLEACRRSAVERLRHLRLLQDQSPGDLSFARWVAETETELASVKSKLHALKTPAARLQACLSKKAGADKEVVNATATARAAVEVLDLANGRLLAATDAQAELEKELQELRLDGLLGPGAQVPAAAPDPVDLFKVATAILAAVSPSTSIPPEILKQMAVMCNLCAPGPSGSAPGGTDIPPAASQVRARSPSESSPGVQEAPAVRAAKATYEAALAAEAAREAAYEVAEATQVGLDGGIAPMEVADSGATASTPGRMPVLVPPRGRG
jgi:hypothetical protein